MKPVARTKGLASTEHDEGLVLYDEADHHAHSLNAVSAFVWLEADGVNTIEDIATHLGAKLGVPDAVEMRALVVMAVSQLRQSGLILPETTVLAGAVDNAMSRRAAAATIGKAAILVGGIIPMVRSLIAPEPAFAQSTPHTGNCQTIPGPVPAAPPICVPAPCPTGCQLIPITPPPAVTFTCVC